MRTVCALLCAVLLPSCITEQPNTIAYEAPPLANQRLEAPESPQSNNGALERRLNEMQSQINAIQKKTDKIGAVRKVVGIWFGAFSG